MNLTLGADDWKNYKLEGLKTLLLYGTLKVTSGEKGLMHMCSLLMINHLNLADSWVDSFYQL